MNQTNALRARTAGDGLTLHAVDAMERPCVAQFRERYHARGVPVLLRGFLEHWPARKTWSPAVFAQRFAAVMIEVMGDAAAPQPSSWGPYGRRHVLPMAEFAMLVDQASPPDLYLVAQNGLLRQRAFASLWDDLCFDGVWLAPERAATGVNLWMGPRGACTPLHFDLQNALLAQVCGSKRVLLAVPAAAPNLYTTPGSGYAGVDAETPDLDTHPRFRDVALYEAVIAPGDALFLPHGWWHQVRALTASISLSMSNFAWDLGWGPR